MANILVVGKDLPESESLIKNFELKGHKIFATASSDISINNDNIFTFSWNKASSISAKTLLIQAESRLVQIDRILIVFDGTAYAKKFESERIEDCTQAVENMISGYIYFCQTLLNRLSQKNKDISISFYLKTAATKADIVSAKGIAQAPCANTVAIAQAAFKSTAENFCAALNEVQGVKVFLVQSEPGNELYANDRETGGWFLSYFEALEKLKNKPATKQALSWVKAGGKMPGSFALFR
ncbi:MAG: hypothetical protein MJ182_09005 [Treponema sp.]|nr:hypothetical protein [Treponema sp.]